MKARSIVSAWIVALCLAAAPLARAADTPLPRSTPEAQGISSQAVREFVEAADPSDNLRP
jgi:hypothetical protein